MSTPTLRRRPDAPWRHAPFRALLGGGTAQAFGNSITPVALAFAVLHLGGSATQLGVVVAGFALAEVVTVLAGGVLGDRVAPRALMQGAAAATAVCLGVLAALLVTGVAEIWQVGLLGAVNGCIGALGGPAASAVTRRTVPADQLPRAVTLRRLGQQGGAVLGFASGGLAVAWLGPGWALAVDAAVYALAALAFGGVRVEAVAGAREHGESVWAELRAGAATVFRHTWLWLLISQALVYHLFYGGAQGVLGPVRVDQLWGEAAWGWSLSALMGGFVLGGLVCLSWRPRRGLWAGTLLLALTAAFPLAMAWGQSLPVLMLAAAVHGFGLEVFSVNWDLAIQQNVAPDMLARVYAFDMVGSFVARPLGLVLVGPVSAALGVVPWLLVVASVMGLTSLVAASAPAVRTVLRRDA